MSEHPLVRRVLEVWYAGPPNESRLQAVFDHHVRHFTDAMDDVRERLWCEVERLAAVDAESKSHRDVDRLAQAWHCELVEVAFGGGYVQAVVPPRGSVFSVTGYHELLKSPSEPWGTFHCRLEAQRGLSRCQVNPCPQCLGDRDERLP